MAIGKPSILSGISGNIGSVEYSMTRRGMVMKPAKPSKRMDSPREMKARTDMARHAALWRSLDEDQVRSWDAYAAAHPVTNRLGDVTYLSGRSFFAKLRMPVSDAYDPFVEVVPPLESTLPIFEDIGILWFGGPYWFLTFTDAPDDDNLVWMLWIARFQSRTTTHKSKSWISIPPALRKPLVLDQYDIFKSAGVELCDGEHVAVRHRLRAPDLWPSNDYIRFQTVQPRIHLWYTCDDNLPTNVVLNSKWQDNAYFVDPGGSPNTLAHSVAGHIGLALYFDGIDDSIIITPANHYDVMAAGTDFTIAIWWKCDSPNPAESLHFVSNYLKTVNGVIFYTLGDKHFIAARVPDGGGVHTLEAEWPEAVDSNWHHWAFSRRGTTLTAYKDGVAAASDTHVLNSQALADPARNLAIGSKYNTGNWAPGTADDFRLYDYALNGAQIAALAAM